MNDFDFNFDFEIPEFDFTGFDPIDNEPINSKFKKSNIEKDIDDKLKLFVDADHIRQNTIDKQADGTYYFSVIFQTTDQRNKFLREMKILNLLRDNYFISGMQLAKKMSIDLDRFELSKKKFKKTNFDNII